jgi:hypothetical protein
VPEVPESIVVIESTANMADETGEFRVRWDEAEKGTSPYAPFFSPWHEEPTYRSETPFEGEPDEYEQWLMDDLGLTKEQLQWRRRKIAGDFAGDVIRFKQEFPATPAEAFQSPEGKVYPILNPIRHDLSHDPRQLQAAGYTFYRAIDWGGVDPFVCLWVAHKPGDPGLTIDRSVCKNTWREHARLSLVGSWQAGGPGQPIPATPCGTV